MANSVRTFVIESLKGFYEKLPLKKVAVDGSVLTPDASGIVDLGAIGNSPWEPGDGENSAQLKGTTGAIGYGAVAHFENGSGLPSSIEDEDESEPSEPLVPSGPLELSGPPIRSRSIQSGDSSTTITYVSEWTISGNTDGTYYDVGNGSFEYPKNAIVFIEYNGVKRMVKDGYQNYLNTDYPFVFSNDDEGNAAKGGTREITDTYLDNVHVNVTEVRPALIGSGAVGDYSHVEGTKTSALGDYSHAEGASEISVNAISVYSSENIEYINGEYWSFDTNYGFVALLGESGMDFKIPSQITIYSDPECQTVMTVIDNVESNHIVYIDNSDMGFRYYLVFDLPSEYADLEVFDMENGGFLYCYVKDNGGAFADYSHTEGYNTKALGSGSHAEGSYTIATGAGSHAEGYNTNAKNEYSHAEGEETTADGVCSHTEGIDTNAEGGYSHAEGERTTVLGWYSHAEGYDASANANHSHAEGYQTLTWCENSHAEGNNTATFSDINNVYNSNAHAEGSGTIAMSAGAHAEGCGNNYNDYNIQGRDWNNYVDLSYVKPIYGSGKKLYKLNGFQVSFPYKRKLNTLRTGDVIWLNSDHNINSTNHTIIDYFTDQDGSVYIGLPNYNFTVNNIIPKFGTARGRHAHSEGACTVADGSASHSEGCFTIAMGEGSHAEGCEAYAFGVGSHSEGCYSIAAGKYSHAEGGADSSDASTTITYGKKPYNYSYTEATPYIYSCTGPWSSYSSGSSKYLDVAVGTALTDGSNYYYVAGKRDNLGSGSNRYSTIILDKPIIISNDSSITIPCLYNSAKGIGSHAEGFNAKALNNYSHAEGYNAKAVGTGSHAEGYQTRDMSYITRRITANRDSSLCTITDTSGILADNVIMQNGKYAVVKQVVNGSTLLLDRSLSPDTSVDASGFFYGGKYAAGDYSHTEGYETFAVKIGSHTEGYRTTARGDYSHAEGSDTSTIGIGSHAEGYKTIANFSYSHAEGSQTKAAGSGSHAEGSMTITNGNYSHAEGYKTDASGNFSHAEGYTTTASGGNSHAEGRDTMAKGSGSHVEGTNSRNITILISYAVRNTKTYTYTKMSPRILKVGDILGYGNTATVTAVSSTSFTVDKTLNPYELWSNKNVIFDIIRGDTSYGVAIGNYSHAEGVTCTNNDYEHAEGVWNVSHKNSSPFDASCDGNTLFSVGAGIQAPSNAVEVMQNGDVYVRGIGNYDGSNYIDASTLQEVIDNGSGGVADLMTNVTYSELKALRDSSSLVPGMQYRITDYHTTVLPLITDASSADHQFDIIVTADSSTVLNENARAARHTGDTYFAACKLEAWTLQYRLENEKWSKVAGTFIEEDGDSYHLRKLGTVEVDGTTYVLWDASELTDDYEIVQAVSEDEEVGTELKGYDPETGEILDEGWTSSIASKAEVEADGQGTILMLKDEYGNQCPYDFKSIQFKRWAVTDSQQGREGLDGKYMGVLNNVPTNISIEDEDDFIWAYTFSSDATGSEDQVDYSLDGTHWVYGNVLEMAPDAMNALNDVVFYGECNYSNHLCFDCYCNTFGNYCNDNSFGNGCTCNSFGNNCGSNSFGNYFQSNTFGNNCYNNSFGNNCMQNSFGNSCQNNTFGNSFQLNSFGNDYYNNSFGNGCMQNSFGNNCGSNLFGNGCMQNSFGNNCGSNLFGNNCYRNSFGNYCQSITVFDSVTNCSVTGGSQNAPVKNAQILNGTTGASYQNKLTIAFTANQNYTQIAGLNSSGVLKIWTPADLIN